MQQRTSLGKRLVVGLVALATGACEPPVSTQPVGAGVTLSSAVSGRRLAIGEMAVRTLTVSGTGAAAGTLALTEAIGPRERFVPGSCTGPVLALRYSHDGGQTFDADDTLPVTHIRWIVGLDARSGAASALSYRTEVHATGS